MDFAAGSIVADRYQLDRLIGEGGAGVVWAATHLVTHKPVALKFLKIASPEATRRFLREARITSVLGHPNIVEVHDVFQLPDGLPTMVMELLAGEALEARIEREGRLGLRDLAQVILPVISAVGSAHALGVVHRDLKPENIFLASRSPGSLGAHPQTSGSVHVKVLDFGIAKLTALQGQAARTSALTQTGMMLGTPYYMSPEQIFGENVDHRADVWALGVILYQCLSGRRPFDGETFGQLFKSISSEEPQRLDRMAPGLPADVVELVARMLARSPDHRPADLREVYDVLGRYSDLAAPQFEAPVPPRDTTDARSLPPPSPGPARPRRLTWLVIAAPALLAAVTLTLLGFRSSQTAQAPMRSLPAQGMGSPPPTVEEAPPKSPGSLGGNPQTPGALGVSPNSPVSPAQTTIVAPASLATLPEAPSSGVVAVAPPAVVAQHPNTHPVGKRSLTRSPAETLRTTSVISAASTPPPATPPPHRNEPELLFNK